MRRARDYVSAALCLALCSLPVLAAAPEATPFGWSVESTSAHPVVRHVLLGSVHLLPASAYPLPAGIEDAYAHSRALVLETDPSALQEPELQKRMLEAARAPKGGNPGLSSLIVPALYEKVRQRAVELKLPATLCDPFRAWFCALSLELHGLQGAGLESRYGIDQHFFDRAMSDERSVRWLEKPLEQVELFTQMDDATSEQFLRSSLRDLSEPASKPSDLLRQWRTDDRGAIERKVAEMKRDFPAIYNRVLAARNRNWMAQLEGFMREPEPQLVIVGAAHLLGPEGLPSLLALRGWKVTPLGAAAP